MKKIYEGKTKDVFSIVTHQFIHRKGNQNGKNLYWKNKRRL